MASKSGRHAMPCQSAAERVHNFAEVALGYTPELAIEEALRCLQCKKPTCRQGCPVGVLIPDFIGRIREGDFAEASRILKIKNALPAICGRVCPQEAQCESQCILGKKGEPVAIGRLERFTADWGIGSETGEAVSDEAGQVNRAAADNSAVPDNVAGNRRSGKKVAVIGGGPAGLACAGDLAKLGYTVKLFEALHTAGGVLMYGIPEFRLPKAIVQKEIANLKELGVEILTDQVIGKIRSVDDLLKDFDAVFIATGAGLPHFMGIPGENLNGVYAANEFLTRTNLMKGYQFPTYRTPVKVGAKVAVLGAGNVAMDAARTALRLGAERVTVIYRRSRAEMPARNEEIEHAVEEGIEFLFLTSPVSFQGNEADWLESMVCVRCELGEPDKSGRRASIPISCSEFELPVDTAIIAIGQGPNPLVTKSTPHLTLDRRGNIVADPETLATSIPGVYAGGDIVTGAATVILAMGAGKKAAESIDRYLQAQ